MLGIHVQDGAGLPPKRQGRSQALRRRQVKQDFRHGRSRGCMTTIVEVTIVFELLRHIAQAEARDLSREFTLVEPERLQEFAPARGVGPLLEDRTIRCI